MTNCSEGKAGTVHPECVGEKHYSDDHGTGSAQKMSKAPDVDLEKKALPAGMAPALTNRKTRETKVPSFGSIPSNIDYGVIEWDNEGYDMEKDEGGAMPDTTVANALEKADSSDDPDRHRKSAEMLAQRNAEKNKAKNKKDKARKDAKKKSDAPEKEDAPKEKPKPASDGRDKYDTKYKPVQQWDQRTPAERERGDPIPESFQGKRTPMVQETPPAGSTQHPQDQHQYSRKIPGDASGSAPKVAMDPDGRVIPTTRKVRDPNAKARKGISSQPVEFKPKVKPAEGEEDPSQRKAGSANRMFERVAEVINSASNAKGNIAPEKVAEIVSRFYTNPDTLSPRMRGIVQGVADELTTDTATYTNPRIETRADADAKAAEEGFDFEEAAKARQKAKAKEERRAAKARELPDESAWREVGMTPGQEKLYEIDKLGQKFGTGVDEFTVPDPVFGDDSNVEVRKPNFQEKRGDYNLTPQQAEHRKENITPNPNVGETFTAVIDDEHASKPTNAAEPDSPLFTQRGTPMDQVRETKVAPQKTMQGVGKDMGRIAATAEREAGMPKERFTPDISGPVQKSTDSKPPSFSELMKSKGDVRYSERGMPSGMHPYGHNFNGQAIPIQNGYRQVFIHRDEPVMPAPGKMKITKN